MKRTAPLPAFCDYAFCEIASLTPSITCVLMAFVPKQEYRLCYNSALRRPQRETDVVRKGRSHILHGPSLLKAAEISGLRAKFRDQAFDWFKWHLPGAFAHHGQTPARCPPASFLRSSKRSRFPNGGLTKRGHQSSYISLTLITNLTSGRLRNFPDCISQRRTSGIRRTPRTLFLLHPRRHWSSRATNHPECQLRLRVFRHGLISVADIFSRSRGCRHFSPAFTVISVACATPICSVLNVVPSRASSKALPISFRVRRMF